ncbi:uncharacterized protein ATC70_008140 [Mucor velutinosus]|uniref:Uncharacterized protein n=1 Tax=Mucor velutinosus TaxID=708070 RepID=A0AAN7I3W1_9FUNG|nr:hypothetical protein ATC70_008140 [Mucor velutinosus]
MFSDAPLAKLLDGGFKLKLANNVVSASCNFADAGTRFTCYFNHPYFIKYFAVAGSGSYHSVYGPSTITAYKQAKSYKPDYSLQASKVQQACVQLRRISVEIELEESVKLDLVISVFMLRHWGKEQYQGIKLNFDEGDRDQLYDKIEGLQRKLKMEHLLSQDTPPIVTKVDYVLQTATSSRRPGVVQSAYDYDIHKDFQEDLCEKVHTSWLREPIVFPKPTIAT